MNRFDTDTAITPLDPKTWEGRVDRGWWITRGPNGGYVAAIMLRALMAAVDDADRSPRSLTVHYLAPPADGPVRLEATVERKGRSLAFATGRMRQGDRLIAVAVGAFSPPWDGPAFDDRTMPSVPPPAACPAPPADEGPSIPMRERYDIRHAIGRPPNLGPLPPGTVAASEAVSGGWIRLAEPRAVDCLLAAALTDAWVPSVFSKLGPGTAVPTVDLTVHFRSTLPRPELAPDAYVLSVFRSSTAAEGFLDEDGEIWTEDGVLLAQSRQLAVLLPMS